MDTYYDIVIAGAGPAGMTAAIYASRAGLKTLILEKKYPGGQVALTDFVENYPGFPDGISGWDLTTLMQTQALKYGAELRTSEVMGIKKSEEEIFAVETPEGVISATTCVIATGATYRRLGIIGEDRYYGRGVSQCATCDGAFYKDGTVVVVGGGDTALQETLFLARLCKKIHLVHRRGIFRAIKILQDRVLSMPDKIVTHFNTTLMEVYGDEKVRGIVLKDGDTGQESRIPVDGVFIFIGLNPISCFAKGAIEMDEAGYIITDESMMTSIEGIYACGDVRKKEFRQIANACGEGALAAHSAHVYIEGLKGKTCI